MWPRGKPRRCGHELVLRDTCGCGLLSRANWGIGLGLQLVAMHMVSPVSPLCEVAKMSQRRASTTVLMF